MSTTASTSFVFDYFRYNGKGNRPSLVPTVDQANFIRSRFSIEENKLDLAAQRVSDWATRNGIGTIPKKPYPSSQAGRYWMEFQVGGLTL